MNAPVLSARSPLGLVVRGLLMVAALVAIVACARILLVLFAAGLFALFLHRISALVARWTRLPARAVLIALVLSGLVLSGALVFFSAARAAEELRGVNEQLGQAWDGLRGHLQRVHVGSGSAADVVPNFAAEGKKLGSAVLAALGGTLEVLSGLVVIFFIGVYGAAQPEVYVQGCANLAPAGRRADVRRALRTAGDDLWHWLLARLIAMTFVGVTCAIAFALLGVPLALPLSVLAGLLTGIEYAGALISAAPAILLGFSRGPLTALWVGLVFTGLHVVEGYLLTPVVTRASVRLPPAFTLGAQVLFGVLLGPLGLTFSTPLLVLIISMSKSLRDSSGKAQRNG